MYVFKLKIEETKDGVIMSAKTDFKKPCTKGETITLLKVSNALRKVQEKKFTRFDRDTELRLLAKAKAESGYVERPRWYVRLWNFITRKGV